MFRCLEDATELTVSLENSLFYVRHIIIASLIIFYTHEMCRKICFYVIAVLYSVSSVKIIFVISCSVRQMCQIIIASLIICYVHKMSHEICIYLMAVFHLVSSVKIIFVISCSV